MEFEEGNVPSPAIPEALSHLQALADGEIHLWRCCRDLTGNRLAEAAAHLSAAEHARADRFRFPRDRDRFRAGRGLLRCVLSRYLGVEPGRVEIATTPEGKPFLAGPFADAGIRFNVSHSDGVAVFALACGGDVGVDVEQVREDIDCDALALHCLSLPEMAEWHSLGVERRRETFFGFWTRKEAYVKALGTGLSHPLREFAVSLAEPTVRLLTPEGRERGVADMRLFPIECGPGYIGALAFPGTNGRLRHFAL